MIKEIFGRKLGMTQIFDAQGNRKGVTVVEVEPVCLLEKMEYPTKNSVKVGIEKTPQKRIVKMQKPVLGYFKKLGLEPYKKVREIILEKGITLDDALLKTTVGVSIFKEGETVHVRAKSKGRGFTGGMKRHGWSGQPASHGHMTHRRIGSAGSNTYPGRSLRGLRMAGHMGDTECTTRNIQIVKVDPEKNLLFLHGSVPGVRGSFVNIKKA